MTSTTMELSYLQSCGLYYKHVTIVNYASSGVNKLKASVDDDARVLIYDCHMFIVQATGMTHCQRAQKEVNLNH